MRGSRVLLILAGSALLIAMIALFVSTVQVTQ